MPVSATCKDAQYVTIRVASRKLPEYFFCLKKMVEFGVLVVFIQKNVLSAMFEKAMPSEEAKHKVFDRWMLVSALLKFL